MGKKLYFATALCVTLLSACNLPNLDNNNDNSNKTNIYTTSCNDSEQGWIILDSNNVVSESGRAWWTADASCSGTADVYYRVVVSSGNISDTTAPFDSSVTALKQTFVKFQVYTTTTAGENLAITEMNVNCPKGQWRDIDFDLFVGPGFPTTQYGWFKFDGTANKVYARSHDLAAYEGSETLEDLSLEYPTDGSMVEYSLGSSSAETLLPTL